MAKDSLARGARSAQFFTGPGTIKGKVELKNLAPEGRDTSLDNITIGPVAFKERKLRPINKQVYVRRIVSEETTAGGIVLSEGAKDKPLEGVVIAVSKLVTQVTVGEHVLFGKYAGTEVPVGGTKDNLPLLMEEDEILAVLED